MKSGNGDLAPNLSNEALAQCHDQLRVKFEDRLKNVLTRIKIELESFSWFCSKIYELEDGVYAIGVSRDQDHLTRDGEPDELDVEIVAQLMDSMDWANIRGGASFNVNVLSYGGELVGGFTPFLFADSQWVPIIDEAQIEARMKLLEEQEPFGMVKLLQKWVKGKAAR